MSIPEPSPVALPLAHALADAGAPIFSGRLNGAGNPDTKDTRWSRWQSALAGRKSHSIIEQWRSPDALCMVAGVKYDVIDIDPRNGGLESFNKLQDDLGDNGPEVYLRTKTPSGGLHLYISPLGVGTLHGFLPGIDLQGGKPDGTSRGFVFIPPTMRPAKWGKSQSMRPYVPQYELRPFNGSGNTGPIKKLIERYQEDKYGEQGPARTAPNELRLAVLAAGPGEQRPALLRYVHELERRGYSHDDIITLCAALEIVNYDRRRPWRKSDFQGLLHRAGRVIPDALPGELDGIEDSMPIRVGLIQSVSEAPDELVDWLWEMYLAIGELVIIDGEKGQGKTFVTDDIAARLSRGDPMPGADKALFPACNTIIFTYEGTAAIKPRLLAANANLKHVFVPNLERPQRRGEDQNYDPLALPEGHRMIAKMIREADAKLAIFDPIADFLSADVQTHNDASVRLALRPLGVVLRDLKCAGAAIRHMNKQKDAGARFRGTGSSAFQNRSRVHLIVGELPDLTDEGERQFAIGMADSNDTKRVGGALSYLIKDSDIPLDNYGRMVGCVEWQGYVDVDVNQLSKGPSLDGALGKRGPIPIAQEMVIDVLEQLFGDAEGFAVPAQTALTALKQAGCSTSPGVLAKARKHLGITVVREREGGMTSRWIWVIK